METKAPVSWDTMPTAPLTKGECSMAITGGSVSYSRTANLGDYNSKKAEATFAFDTEADTLAAAAKAITTVEGLLGGKLLAVAAEVAASSDTPNVDRANALKAAHAAKNGADATKPTKPKKVKASPADIVEEPATEPAANISTGGERVDPSAVEDFNEPGTAIPAVTDEELGVMANRAARALGDGGSLKVRQLLMDVTGVKDGGAIRNLTSPELRQLFVKKLAELK
jgi:hypothetical protein